MSVSYILGGFATFAKLRSSQDDDWVDRMNHVYTVALLALFAVFVSGGQFFGNPIECWCPAHFTPSMVAFTKSICWVNGTYFIPMQEGIPSEHELREREQLPYYQWVPVMLLFMAFLFKFPAVIWRLLSTNSGISLEKIINIVTEQQMSSPEKREEITKHIAQYIDRWLEVNRQYHWNCFVRMRQRLSKCCCILFQKRAGTYLTGLYILVKLLYVANVISQFFLLDAFLGGWYSMYGFETLASLSAEHQWEESRRFPKVTLCDFDIRQLNNVQRQTVQCVLPYNLFNEKIFIFLWFWFLLVATVTFYNLLVWLWLALMQNNRGRFVKKHLKEVDALHGEVDKKLAKRFADQYLRDDGIFVLRLIVKNSSEILFSDVMRLLWLIYKNKHNNIQDESMLLTRMKK
ncbi:innexin unc-9-like [Gigantopelta aegis]|uniref:innexin unc-9-like n=1 Tax=Gigantopelta aegis TaxID=1735272 RepID=UPI001B88C13A|nr:innexin unc-9-like [Gigantopelta aegis]